MKKVICKAKFYLTREKDRLYSRHVIEGGFMNTAIESLGHLAAQVELQAQNPMLHPEERQRLLDLADRYREAQLELLAQEAA